MFNRVLIIIAFLLVSGIGYAYTTPAITFSFEDSIPKKVKKIDSTHSPKKAMRRSLMLPGWGQVYNKQLWKVPIIYAGLGITGYIFFDNLKIYNDIRKAYNARYTRDSIGIANIPAYLNGLDLSGLALNRRKFRQSVDYSVLFFVAFWGLNVADAVVFGHLKNFDVSDNISGNISIGNSNIANTSGIQLKFDIHKAKQKKLIQTK